MSAAGATRLAHGYARGRRYLEDHDVRAEGVTEFSSRQTLLTQTGLTARDLAELRLRSDAPVRHPIHWLAARLARGFSESWTVLYVGGALHNCDPATGRWVTTDADRVAKARHLNDPLWLIDVLPAATGEVADAGAGRVRGSDAQGYSFAVDLTAASDAIPQRLYSRREERDIEWMRQMPMEAWLDSRKRLCRIAGVPFRPKSGSELVWSIVEFWDVGIAPAPDVHDPCSAWLRSCVEI